MKRNRIHAKLLTAMVAASMALSVPAFAQENVAAPAAPTETTSTDQTAAEEMLQYTTESGTIESVEPVENGYITVMITNENGGFVFQLKEDVKVINQKDASFMSAADLETGMEITALIPSLAPVTLSLPPITSSVELVIVQDGVSSLKYDKFNNELISSDYQLKLNIGEDTTIVDFAGTKQAYSAEDIQDKEALVFYTVTTRSIPAMTTPSFVMLFPEDTASEITADTQAEDTAVTSIGLRQAAETAGYEVKWVSNDEPVELVKEDTSILISVGESKISVNGVEETLQLSTELEDGTIMVSSEIVDFLQ